jgi:pyruvate dehydrogenase (quinone)
MGALRRAADRIEFVQARHEENAAFMAVGHAKYSGSVGVVTSTQGPGAIHLLNGLYDAKLDGVPVVAIVGQQNTSVLGSDTCKRWTADPGERRRRAVRPAGE